jgi:hypothetical protein
MMRQASQERHCGKKGCCIEARHLHDAVQVFQFGEFAGWVIEG